MVDVGDKVLVLPVGSRLKGATYYMVKSDTPTAGSKSVVLPVGSALTGATFFSFIPPSLTVGTKVIVSPIGSALTGATWVLLNSSASATQPPEQCGWNWITMNAGGVLQASTYVSAEYCRSSYKSGTPWISIRMGDSSAGFWTRSGTKFNLSYSGTPTVNTWWFLIYDFGTPATKLNRVRWRLNGYGPNYTRDYFKWHTGSDVAAYCNYNQMYYPDTPGAPYGRTHFYNATLMDCYQVLTQDLDWYASNGYTCARFMFYTYILASQGATTINLTLSDLHYNKICT